MKLYERQYECSPVNGERRFKKSGVMVGERLITARKGSGAVFDKSAARQRALLAVAVTFTVDPDEDEDAHAASFDPLRCRFVPVGEIPDLAAPDAVDEFEDEFEEWFEYRRLLAALEAEREVAVEVANLRVKLNGVPLNGAAGGRVAVGEPEELGRTLFEVRLFEDAATLACEEHEMVAENHAQELQQEHEALLIRDCMVAELKAENGKYGRRYPGPGWKDQTRAAGQFGRHY